MADFDPFIKKEKAPGYGSLDESEVDLEENNEISQLESGLAGIASGVLKIPEGFVSLGAELMDYSGITENSAARVEQVFDKINVFEEVAQEKATGRILEALVQIGVPATAGAKIATKLATKHYKQRKLELM